MKKYLVIETFKNSNRIFYFDKYKDCREFVRSRMVSLNSQIKAFKYEDYIKGNDCPIDFKFSKKRPLENYSDRNYAGSYGYWDYIKTWVKK